MNINFERVSLDTPQTQNDVSQLFNELERLTPQMGLKDIDRSIQISFTGFIENLGQNLNEFSYYYSDSKSQIGFSTSQINVVQLVNDNWISIDINFFNSNPTIPSGIFQMQSTTNVFDSTQSYTDINNFEEIWYYNLYDNIDLRYYMTDEGLKYDFIVNPNGDPNDINIQVSDDININISDKQIDFSSDDAVILSDKDLYIYQDSYQGDEIIRNGKFISKSSDNSIYGFKIENYDTQQKLIIDPLLLEFSSVIGGSRLEYSKSMAIDSSNNIYITGWTRSFDFPTVNPYNSSTNGAYDVFVYKLNSTGNGLIYSTYIGGSSDDFAESIEIDVNGNIYVSGFTNSLDFPLVNAYSGYVLSTDIFIFKLNVTGNGLIYSTYIGGNDIDQTIAIVLDSSGNVYMTGFTRSTDFPTVNSYDATHNGDFDVFVLKLNSTGNGLIYSTYIGGSQKDGSEDIKIDSSDNIYITGVTKSFDFPLVNSNFQIMGWEDVFVVKLNSTGNGLIYSTVIGGSQNDYAFGLANDDAGNIYVTGYTSSSDFPMVNPYSNTFAGIFDAFIFKLNATGNGLIYSTYIGGNNFDVGNAITIDSVGNVYVVGSTHSQDFPTVDAYDTSLNDDTSINYIYDIFILQLNTNGKLVMSTYLGGEFSDMGFDIIVDVDTIYISGYADSSNFPLLNEYNSTIREIDSFVLKMKKVVDNTPPFISSPADITYEEGSTGNIITWDTGDQFADYFNVTIDGILYVNGPAGNVTTNVFVDGLSFGVHTVIYTVTDTSGNTNSDTVIITVIDTVPPTIDNPVDLGFRKGTAGNIIVWSVSDNNPSTYDITIDGIPYIVNADWDTGVITLNLDDLSIGVHSINLTAYDSSGNYISDIVVVTIIDGTPPTLSSSDDLTYGEDSTNNTISWLIGDKSPGIYNATLDGELYIADTIWTNGTISINVDGLSIGTYSFIIYVFDNDGNFNFD